MIYFLEEKMDFEMTTAFDQDKDVWNIELSGEVDIFNANKMKNGLTELILEKPKNLRINCRALEYIDSTALGALVAVLKNARAYDGEIHLLNVRPNIAKLFRITNLDKVFVIEDGGDKV